MPNGTSLHGILDDGEGQCMLPLRLSSVYWINPLPQTPEARQRSAARLYPLGAPRRRSMTNRILRSFSELHNLAKPKRSTNHGRPTRDIGRTVIERTSTANDAAGLAETLTVMASRVGSSLQTRPAHRRIRSFPMSAASPLHPKRL